jgi:peptidoglycan/xylan/chitin deacetylase (PgdA/CDA1 family)
MNAQVCTWKSGCKFAYSITYDEAFEDLLKYALPIHRKYNIPGHLVAVAGQLGQIRDVPSSSYSGKCRHLSGAQMRELIAEGWSVGDHSMTHGDLNVNPLAEVVESKRVLEDALGQTITIFHLPGADFSFAPAARYFESAGFLAVFFADDRVNRRDPDLFGLSRTLVYVNEGQPNFSLYDLFPREYDPYHRLHEALDCGGWIVDITHLVSPQPIAPWKDATPEILDARFDCLRRVGDGWEWATESEQVVDYILMRRAARLEQIESGADHAVWRLKLDGVPVQVKYRELSATVELPAHTSPPRVLIDGQPVARFDRQNERSATWTWHARDGQLIELV